MGESALKSHAKGKNHIELLKASEPAVPMSCFLALAKTSSAVAASTDSSVSSPGKLNLTEQSGSVPVVKMTDFFTKTETLKAEIFHWLLHKDWNTKSRNSVDIENCERAQQLPIMWRQLKRLQSEELSSISDFRVKHDFKKKRKIRGKETEHYFEMKMLTLCWLAVR